MKHLPRRIALACVALTALLVCLVTGAAQAQQGYSIQAGDVLGIEVLEDPSLSREVLVLPDGSFSFPFAGTVQAGGRTTGQIAATLTAGIASNFATQPNVFVSVRTLRPVVPQQQGVAATISVYFLGEVNAPGLKAVVPGSTLLQVLSQSGGFTNFAALKRIQLRRTDPATQRQYVTTFNYRAIANGAVLSQDVVLAEGDVILVPQRRLFE